MNFTEFKKKFQKVPVEEYSNTASQTQLVSVCVITYNHANYIKDCLDGILMQQTNFNFEILLGEDDSKDGTREICIEYAARFPEKIRLFFHHRENNIVIDGSATGRFNLIYNLFSARGKYIALCEGDDYWTDPLKLQKQVDFLERNIDCVLCHTDAKLMLPNGEMVNGTNKPPGDETTMEDLANGDNYIYTATVLFHKENFSLSTLLLKTPVGDYPLYLLISENGRIKFLRDYTAVYRIGIGLWGRKDSVSTDLIWVKTLTLLIEHFKDNAAMCCILKRRYLKKCSDLVQSSLRQARPWLEVERYYFYLFRHQDWHYIRYLKHAGIRMFYYSSLNFLLRAYHKYRLLVCKNKN